MTTKAAMMMAVEIIIKYNFSIYSMDLADIQAVLINM
jgi:hypothetical protein